MSGNKADVSPSGFKAGKHKMSTELICGQTCADVPNLP